MKRYLKYNLITYLEKDNKKYQYSGFITVILLTSLFVYSLKYDTYNILETTAQVLCEEECILQFFYPIKNGFNAEQIRINDKYHEIENLSFGEITIDTANIGYQKITLKAKGYKGENNKFVKLQIYKNKEKILKKIFKIIKER